MEWTNAELEVVVSAYLSMLRRQTDGVPYTKAQYNRQVCKATGRSRGSVEFKFCNVSAAMRDLGQDWVTGYLPRDHYQQAITEVVLRLMEDDGTATEGVGVGATGDRSSLSFDMLWERATGGTAVAVSPTHTGSDGWPIGRSAPGADEVADDLIASLTGDSPTRMVFLVGGPGNGKSEIARRVTRELSVQQEQSPFVAHRKYVYSTGDTSLCVINDATIPIDGQNSAAGNLASDISACLSSRFSLLANVNRGILSEERLARNSGGGQEGLGPEILEWVCQEALTGEMSSQLSPISTRTFDHLGRSIIVRVVLMDLCSLFERRPEIAIGENCDLNLGSAYVITRLDKRGAVPPEEFPAGDLLQRFVSAVGHDLVETGGSDPVSANLELLRGTNYRTNVLTILRASEIASSRKLTYREVWGAYIRAVVGWLPERHTPVDARAFLQSSTQPNDEQDFPRMADLASVRTHQALVGARPYSGGSVAPSVVANIDNPVLRFTKKVDPALDALPDWSGPVYEAMAFPAEDQSPLTALREASSKLGHALLETEFDRRLDQSWVRWLDTASDKERRASSSWYGEYLVRLYAFSIGRPAFKHELDLWTRAWLSTGPWPPGLKNALSTLVFPKGPHGGAMALPVLEARADPVTSDSAGFRFVRTVDSHSELKRVRQGDALFVRIALSNAEAELELNFDLLREALACHSGHPGISERARATLPRLERFRANLLRPGVDLSYAVMASGKQFDLEIEDIS